SWLPSDIGFVRYLKQAARKNLDRLLYWIARPKLHSVSKAVSDHFGKIYGIGPDQIYHVGRGRSCPNTITSDKRMGIRRNVFKCSEEDFVCINVGRQEYQKNQAALVSAFKNLKGKNFKLVIVGREGEETAKINQAISKNDLFKEVEILGFRHDVTDLLQASDIFLFPSFIEGAAGAVIEAMAASLPVIASDIPPHRELLSNKDGVLLVKSVEEIPLLISELSKDSPSLKKMGEVNFSIFQSEFCDDIIVYKFEKLLRSLYDENPRVRV
ncbi:MAG: glycosyltransferase family 4 protein, partial [Pseudomonadota bacterium]|nr:glycosyltransferase family 4 protein [Pseudomonadota bacterium]